MIRDCEDDEDCLLRAQHSVPAIATTQKMPRRFGVASAMFIHCERNNYSAARRSCTSIASAMSLLRSQYCGAAESGLNRFDRFHLGVSDSWLGLNEREAVKTGRRLESGGGDRRDSGSFWGVDRILPWKIIPLLGLAWVSQQFILISSHSWFNISNSNL